MAISIEKALELVYKHTPKKHLKILPIESVLDMVLAQDIVATHNLPPYDNSAMDGYAVKVSSANKLVRVTHTIFAGDDYKEELECGFGIKIMTGAKIPFGTECIVPIENVEVKNDGVILPDDLELNRHIRFAGEAKNCYLCIW